VITKIITKTVIKMITQTSVSHQKSSSVGMKWGHQDLLRLPDLKVILDPPDRQDLLDLKVIPGQRGHKDQLD
jgi:hypothetical protein